MNRIEAESPTEILPGSPALRRPGPQAVPDPRPVAAPVPAPASEPAPAAPAADHLLCQECRAPVDSDQRYCVSCGARQTHADNPAIGYFAGAAAARRSARTQPRTAGRAPLYGLFFLLLPLAVAIGLAVGRNNSNDNAALLAVLRNQKPIIVNTGGAAGTGAAATSAGTAAATTAATSSAPTTATLASGYVIKLQTLPVSGTTQTSAAAAESAASAKGATQVGLISPTKTQTTPAQGSTNYVIYSGFYSTKTAAAQALGKLKSKFPSATVIAVAPINAAGSASASSATTSPKSVPTTATKIPPKPTAASLKQGASIVKALGTQTGKQYQQTQDHLPPIITIPGSPSAASSTPSSSSPAGQP